jgi:hypothetical protein
MNGSKIALGGSAYNSRFKDFYAILWPVQYALACLSASAHSPEVNWFSWFWISFPQNFPPRFSWLFIRVLLGFVSGSG